MCATDRLFGRDRAGGLALGPWRGVVAHVSKVSSSHIHAASERGMSRRRTIPPPTPALSLFSFLDVLLCTMGALILIFVIIARQARSQASEARAAAVAKAAVTSQSDREELEWRIDQLRQAREKTLAQLAEARLGLSHLEDHARRLADQIKATQLSEEDIARGMTAGGRQRAALEAELAAVRARIDELRREIEDSRQKLANRQPSFAIIPYEGINQTRRRPIYIECRDDAIIIQPEGIVLSVADFAGPLGPGNALASALRAAQEHSLMIQPGEVAEIGQPYPLLVVRPDGITAYYVARAAMSSWSSDFGYELIEADMRLAFPPADPKLAEMMARAVEDARRRQTVLAAAAPRAAAARERPVYRVAPSGGLVLDSTSRSGRSDDGGAAIPYGSGGGNSFTQDVYGDEAGAGGAGSRHGGLSASDRGNDGGLYPDEISPGPRGANGGIGYAGTSNGPTTSPAAMGAAVAGADGAWGGTIGLAGSTAGQSGAGQTGSPLAPGGAPAGMSGGSQTSPAGTVAYDRYPFGSAAAANSPYGGTASGQGGTGQGAGGQPGGTQANGSQSAAAASGGATAGGTSASASGAAGGTPGTGMFQLNGGVPQAGATQSAGGQSSGQASRGGKASLAERRGRDWGLPEATESAIAITRPLVVDCHADHLTIYGSGAGRYGKVVALDGVTEDAVDDFVSAVWDEIRAWGIAGNRMYWKPVLSMHVVQGGEARYEDLEQLLRDSGLEVRRSTAAR